MIRNLPEAGLSRGAQFTTRMMTSKETFFCDPEVSRGKRLPRSHEFMVYAPAEWTEDFRMSFERDRDAYTAEWKLRYRQLWQWDRLACLQPEEPGQWPEWLKHKLDLSPLFLNYWLYFMFELGIQQRSEVRHLQSNYAKGRELPLWLRNKLVEQPHFIDNADDVVRHLLPERRARYVPHEPEAWPFWLREVVAQDPEYLGEWTLEFEALPSLMKRSFGQNDHDNEPPVIHLDLHLPYYLYAHAEPFDATTWVRRLPDLGKLGCDYEAGMKRAVAANKSRYRLLAAFGGFTAPFEPWLMKEIKERPALLDDLKATVCRRWPEFKTFDPLNNSLHYGIFGRSSADSSERFSPRFRYHEEQGYFWWPEGSYRYAAANDDY